MSNNNGQQQNGGNRPAQTFRYGAIKCVIWRNEGRNGSFYNTVITRSYKPDGDEQWRDSDSFGQEHLPTVAKAALDAHSWIQEQLAKDQDGTTSSSEQQGSQKPSQQRQRSQARQPASA